MIHVLIAGNSAIHRLNLKVYIHRLWHEVLIIEVGSLDEAYLRVFELRFDLMILDENMPGSEKLSDFVLQAIKHTKIIIFSEMTLHDPKVASKLCSGQGMFLSKFSTQVQLIHALEYMLHEKS